MLDTAVRSIMDENPGIVNSRICEKLTALRIWNEPVTVQECMDEYTHYLANRTHTEEVWDRRVKCIKGGVHDYTSTRTPGETRHYSKCINCDRVRLLCTDENNNFVQGEKWLSIEESLKIADKGLL